MKREAERLAAAMSLVVVDAEGDFLKQTIDIELFVAQGLGGVFMFVLPEGMNGVIAHAHRKGVCIFNHSASPITGCTQNIVLDQHIAGYKVGSFAAQWINEKRGGRAEVGLLTNLTDPQLIVRSQGLKEGLQPKLSWRNFRRRSRSQYIGSRSIGGSESFAIASLGTALLIIGGNVDLSIGSQYALCTVSTAMLARIIPVPLAWLAGILGALLGYVDALMVLRINISPIIITLGTLTIFRGIALRITNGFGVRGVSKSFSSFGQAHLLGIPMPVCVLIGLGIVAHIVLHITTQGRHLFALGGNKQAAEAAGINNKRLVLSTFGFNGALIGLSAIVAASRFGTAASTFGVGFELDVIAAVILGGIAFTAGEGSITGVLLAVVLLGAINGGLISLVVDPH